MKQYKNWIVMFLLVLGFAFITGCGSNGSADDVEAGEVDTKWAEENGIYETESIDELYEKAKEEGKVVIYANGSKFKDVKISFEKEYPGIKVEPYKITRAELVEKLTREQIGRAHV